MSIPPRPRLHARAVRAAAALAIVTALGCSLATQVKRDDRLRSELDAHRFHRPLSEVWPTALHLVADEGYQLVGRDRLTVGAPPAGRLKRLTAGGFETGRTDGGLALETMANRSGARYRVEGSASDAHSCRVVFIAIRRTGDTPSEERSRDLDMELALIRRLDPDEAERIAGAADAAARR